MGKAVCVGGVMGLCVWEEKRATFHGWGGAVCFSFLLSNDVVKVPGFPQGTHIVGRH
ncbi:hypothetical protein JCM19237_3603 [Photobacterium aphoticum]|uniref:Uncharacterized protein n=1 Tax=Photobacterium aphoticum TaxID=754436 RepID=A0A090QPW5_9GAMM|nr:hypothetical protein JCM19237_3603 [Photobacterium aphoticum]